MSITLNQVYPAGTIRLDGGCSVVIEDQRDLVVKTTGKGVVEELLDASVPAGKKWNVSINISILEIDA